MILSKIMIIPNLRISTIILNVTLRMCLREISGKMGEQLGDYLEGSIATKMGTYTRMACWVW